MAEKRNGAAEETAVAGGVTLRRARLSDLSSVQELYRKQVEGNDDPFTALQDNEVLVAWDMRRLRQRLMAEQSYLCHVAELNGVIVGYGAGIVERPASVFRVREYGAIGELYVEETMRGNGIGEQLLRALLDDFHSLGITWIEATIPANAGAAQEALCRLGFVPNTQAMKLRLGE